MASKTDQQQQSIRERKMAAQRKLRAQLEAQEELQSNAFGELDQLAKLLESAANIHGEDLFKRAAQLTKLTGQLAAQLDEVCRAAQALVDGGSMAKSDVAELLGTRQAALFKRANSSASKPAAATIAAPVQLAAEAS